MANPGSVTLTSVRKVIVGVEVCANETHRKKRSRRRWETKGYVQRTHREQGM